MKKEKLKELFDVKNVLFATYLMNVYDVIISVKLFKDFGKEIELNPLGILLYEKGMLYPAKLIGVGIASIVLYEMLLKRPNLEWVKWIVFGVYFALTIYHIFGSTLLYSVASGI